MKIQEFRDKIKKCPKEDLEKIAAELYKMLPKSKKEEMADQLIDDIIAGKSVVVTKKKETIVDFELLKKQIEHFLSDVDNNYYVAPNRNVPKSERSKWRFEVKGFVKMINKIPVDGENGTESARLLRELYKRLVYGCGYYILPSEDPFQAIGIRQPDFYDMLVNRTFATGYTDENLKNMLEDAALVYMDRNSLQIELEAKFVKSLPTNDLKYKALDLIMKYVDKYESKLKSMGKWDDDRYKLEEHIEEMCKTMLIISISLFEPDDAVRYFWKHYISPKNEITLYVMLDVIEIYGDDELWIKVYEEGLKKKIEPRSVLKKRYNEIMNSRA